MDILRFINSKDIREYLKLINYEFNSLETAWLIYQCKNATILEKHSAWRELIKTMPDCEIPKRLNAVPQKSLHNFLNKYIEIENKILNEFFSDTKNGIYTLECFDNDNLRWISHDIYYKTFDEIFDYYLYWSKEHDRSYVYNITKTQIGNYENIIVKFSQNNEPILCVDNLYFIDNEEFFKDEEVLKDVFSGLWFDFPTPFKKGDILCQYDFLGNETSGLCNGPFVMTAITPAYAKDWTRKNGDTTDMNAWGFFQGEDGRIYSEKMCNYMNLEYYRGQLDGKRQILKAFSIFTKGKIDAVLLCNVYHNILCEKYAKECKPVEYDDILKLVGVEK